jgi:hypothetical protein
VSGRHFTPAEAASRAAVAVVSESTARRFWPGASAVGQTLRIVPGPTGDPTAEIALPSPVVEVVGIARDVKGYSMAGENRNATPIYLPLPALQAAKDFILRANGDPELARRALAERLTPIAPNLPMLIKMQTFGALATYPLAVAFWVTVVLGGVALTLTLSGIYSVLSYLVVQRTKEVGVRMALGATSRAVTGLVLWQSLRLVAIGVGMGASFALIVSTLLMSTAGDQVARIVDPFDPVAYAGSLLSIVAASALAALVPARRAARIDPMTALRHD